LDTNIWSGFCVVIAEAEALLPELLALDFGVSALDFGVSALDFGVSDEEADGGEVGLEGGGFCAKADDSINPLSAVVTNNFLSIENLHECGRLMVVRRARLFAWGLGKPALHNPTFDARRCSEERPVG
jgi:hypothetical protein